MKQSKNIPPHFVNGNLACWRLSATTLDYGGILICRKGSGTILHNFRKWEISEGATMAFFPNDMVKLESASEDFDTRMLAYSAEMLRSASLQVEDTVYEWLRNDCCTTDPRVFDITSSTFRLLEFYMDSNMPASSGQIMLLHLKAYFLGLHDSVISSMKTCNTDGSAKGNRIKEQFNLFMEMLEKDHMTCHSVSHYAGKLSITPKHLSTITKRISGKSAKDLIDEYVVMQLKLCFSGSSVSVKETAWKYNFPSTAFLCSYFARHTGMTPMQYRRMHSTGKG